MQLFFKRVHTLAFSVSAVFLNRRAAARYRALASVTNYMLQDFISPVNN